MKDTDFLCPRCGCTDAGKDGMSIYCRKCWYHPPFRSFSPDLVRKVRSKENKQKEKKVCHDCKEEKMISPKGKYCDECITERNKEKKRRYRRKITKK